jgi:ankyrin repeat protein
MIKKSLIEITDIRAILFESINNRFYDMLELMGKNSLIDENLRFFNNDSLFHIAARENDVIAIKILFKYIPLCINEPNNLFCSPLHSAINSRSLEVIKELINQRANMYLVDDKGCDALFLAIKSGSIVIFNHIISAGYKIDVNLTDYRGNNLLMMAVGTTSAYIQKNRISKDSLESRVSIIKKLLEFNFDFNHKNHKNKNVLDVSHDLITKTVIQPFNNVKNNTSNKPSI